MADASTAVQQQAALTLGHVWALPPRQRQPWLEHALHRARSLPPDQQTQTLREAVALVRPDGRASLQAFLRLCLIRHTLPAAESAATPAALPPLPPPRPLRPLGLADAAPDIWRVSLALGQWVAAVSVPASVRAAGWAAATEQGAPHRSAGPAHAWATAVMNGLGLAVPEGCADHPSDGDSGLAALQASIQRLAELGPLQQPALVKQWVQVQVQVQVQSGATQDQDQDQDQQPPQPWADALRCICLLIGSPMPPQLMACFDALPSGVQTPDGRY
jgi:hypothetical protein